MTVPGSAADVRRRYYRRVGNAMAAAIALHAFAFAFAPPYAPQPLRLPPNPLRLVNVAAGWIRAPAPARPAGDSAAAAPRVERTASWAAPVVITEAASAAATIALSGTVPPGAVGAVLGGEEDPAPPVFYDFDTPPQAVRRVEPDYPLPARSQGAEGTVVVNVNINEGGRILRAWVAAKTAPEILVSVALDAAYQFEFTPGKQRGTPVKCTVAIPFQFSLRRSP